MLSKQTAKCGSQLNFTERLLHEVMFSAPDHLKRRTPAGGIGREEYIEHLVEEFHTTTNVEAQEQVSANLANFGYDPINYDFLKKSAALNVFLECVASPNDKLALHGIAGICNVCLDEFFQSVILQSENLNSIIKLLNRSSTEIVVNSIATFYQIVSDRTKDIVCTPEVIQQISSHQASPNVKIKKIATLFITDYGSKAADAGMRTT